LFIAAEQTLVADMGSVSIVKFLGATNEVEAEANWFRALEGFLETLPPGVFVRSDVDSGRPKLVFAGGVELTIDLYDLHARPSFYDAWRVRVRPGLSPVVVDTVGSLLWGADWGAAIVDKAGESSYPVNPAGDTTRHWASTVREEIAATTGSDDPRARGWIVRAESDEAPWPWFSDEGRARRAAKALALGADTVGAIFADFVSREPS
jgi:hypothetical protein